MLKIIQQQKQRWILFLVLMMNKDVFIRMKVQEQGVTVTVSLALNIELYGLLYLCLLGRIMNINEE